MRIFVARLLSIALGALLGFYGVLVTVFADGPLKERLLSIFAILLIYFLLSFTWGWFVPEKSWKWGLYLGLPGSFILILYSFTELSLFPYFLLYIILILIISCLGANISSRKKGI